MECIFWNKDILSYLILKTYRISPFERWLSSECLVSNDQVSAWSRMSSESKEDIMVMSAPKSKS